MSRTECLRKCQIRRSIDECKAISEETTVIQEEVNGECQLNLACFNITKLKNNCKKMCSQKDCIQNYIKPIVIDKYSWIFCLDILDNMENKCDLVIKSPWEPQHTFAYRPKMETTEFLCYIASILSLWFGFSIYMTANDLFRTLIKQINRWLQVLQLFKHNLQMTKLTIINKYPLNNRLH